MGTPIPAPGSTIVGSLSIEKRVAELAAEIDAQYASTTAPLVLVCVLKGALIFTADLARRLTIPCRIDFVTASSYGEHTSSNGAPVLIEVRALPVCGRDVLIVEDIVDTGSTAAALHAHLSRAGASSVRLVALLAKSARRERDVHVDWTGFDIPDCFVVGYGLDHDELYRNLPDLRVLDGV